MALEVTNLERKFTLKKNGKDEELKDPNPDLSPEEVVKFYSSSHPELTNGIVEGPKVEGDKAVYTIATKAGKLG